MTNEQKKTAIEWLQEEIRSLHLVPIINGCGPENWADLLEIMETCLEAVRGNGYEPLTLEQLRETWEPCGFCDTNNYTSCSSCRYIGQSVNDTPCSDCSPSGKCGKSYYEPSSFCSHCGRPLTPEAWAELEKRLRG